MMNFPGGDSIGQQSGHGMKLGAHDQDYAV